MKAKRCFKCLKYKPLELFYRHPQMLDGHLNKCKACTKKDVKARYYDPEGYKRIQEYERKRFQTPHRKARVYQYNLDRKLRKPGKTRARNKLLNSIRDGKIERKPCEVCGDLKSQGHHMDYRKPLHVKWLCFVHHRQAHGQLLKVFF